MTEYYIRYLVKGQKFITQHFTGINAYEHAVTSAQKIAEDNKGTSVYFGSKDCHSLDEKRFCWDNGYWKRVVEYCCND
jgi:hypothetical protein